MDKLFITGGNGFLGAWIARQLLEEGTPFTLADLAPDDRILEQVLDAPEIARLERVFGDISDTAFVARALRESGARLVIHLAGLQVPACRQDPIAGARVNVIGTLNVFEAARAHREQVRCIVYASSAAVAGPQEDYGGPIADDAPHRPATHYGVFKTANEGNARVYWQDAAVPSVGLRPLSVYGVGREIGITSGPTKAVRAAVRGEDYTIPFTGTTGFNFAADVAAAFVASARRHREGALALNLPGAVHDVREFVRCIEDEVPAARGRIRCEGGAIPVAYGFVDDGLRRLLGSVPQTPIREGVRRTAERFRALAARGAATS